MLRGIFDVKNLIPKYVMGLVVRKVQRTIINYLSQTLVKEEKLNLLKEDPQIEIQRKYYDSLNNKIQTIRKMFA